MSPRALLVLFIAAAPATAQPPRVSVQQLTPPTRVTAPPTQVPQGTTARAAPADSCTVDTASNPAARQSCLAAEARRQPGRSGEGALLDRLGRQAAVTGAENTGSQVINADAVARELAGSDFQDATPDGAAAAVARGQMTPPPNSRR